MRKSIFVGIPCYDMVAPEVLEDYMRFMYYLGRRYQEYDFYLGIKTKSEQFRARNDIVKAALDVGVDYLLQIDDDHIIDHEETQWATNKYDFLRKLIGHIENNPKIGLVGALYYERGNECRPVLMRKITPTNYEWLKDTDIKGGLQPVDVQGGGCMLINMRVFDWIPGPGYFEPEHIYGTDVQICRKIQEAGFEVYSDTSIELGHLRAQRMIVTGKNRRELLEVKKDKDDQAKAICNYGRMVNQYREDIKEYLGIDEKIASDKFLEYEEWQGLFDEYDNPNDWYIDSSKTFLARQVAVNNPEKPFPAYEMIIGSLKSGINYRGLDWACGTAPISYELAMMGHEVFFLDLPETDTFKFLRWRCKKANLNGQARFISELDDIDNNSLDYIIAMDAIEHFEVEKVRELMAKFAKLLKPGGIFFCNFMTNISFEFPEHIFMDKGKFLEMTAENHLFPISHFIYMKDDSYFEAK